MTTLFFEVLQNPSPWNGGSGRRRVNWQERKRKGLGWWKTEVGTEGETEGVGTTSKGWGRVGWYIKERGRMGEEGY